MSVCFAAVLVLVECVNHPHAGAAYFLSMTQMVNPDTPTAVPTWLTRHPLQLAGHRHGALDPAALVSVRSAVAAILAVCEGPLHVGVAGRTAPAAHLQKNLLIFCGQNTGLHDAVAEQLRGQFHGRPFLPALLLRAPHYLAVQIALYCHSTLSQISALSGAARWMQLDVSAVCLLDGRFVLECLEWFSPPEQV